MNSLIYRNGLRFVVLILVQGLILKNIGATWEAFPYFNIFIYPLFIFLLPLRTPPPLLIFLGFLTGLTTDLFYQSPGIHASVGTFIAYIRPFVLRQLAPRGGYNTTYSPTARRYGSLWFSWYMGILLLLHCFLYFFVEAFTPYYMGEIIIKTIVSFILSFILILVIHSISNLKRICVIVATKE